MRVRCLENQQYVCILKCLWYTFSCGRPIRQMYYIIDVKIKHIKPYFSRFDRKLILFTNNKAKQYKFVLS